MYNKPHIHQTHFSTVTNTITNAETLTQLVRSFNRPSCLCHTTTFQLARKHKMAAATLASALHNAFQIYEGVSNVLQNPYLSNGRLSHKGRKYICIQPKYTTPRCRRVVFRHNPINQPETKMANIIRARSFRLAKKPGKGDPILYNQQCITKHVSNALEIIQHETNACIIYS